MMRALLLSCALAVCFAGSAHAAYTVTFTQSGSDVVANGVGSLITSGLSYLSGSDTAAEVIPNDGVTFTGPTSAQTSVYRFGTGSPQVFGNGSGKLADSGSGDQVGILGQSGLIFVPLHYVSGAFLQDSSTYTGSTYASLGLLPGSYNYMFGSGVTADSFTVVVREAALAAVAEPASLGLLGLGLFLLGARRRRAG